MKTIILLIVTSLSFLFSKSQISNTRPGLWSDPSVWNINRVPLSSDNIILNYDIVVNSNSFCRSLNANGHNITVNSGVKLTVAGNYTSDMLATKWRLYGSKSDTSAESSPWVLENYDTVSVVNYYYCIYVPDSNKYYFSPYKCTYVVDGTYYFLGSACDANKPPFITDTALYQQLANDLVLKTDASLTEFAIAQNSAFINWRASSCSSPAYYPAETDTSGNTGSWSFDTTSNLLAVHYSGIYGNYPHSIPAGINYNVVVLTQNELIINACLTCNLTSGKRYYYKRV